MSASNAATPSLVQSNFSSVKLPTDLVNQARQSAVVFRRSVAGQIEYWAALGQSMERGNLTVREAREALSGSAEHAAIAPNSAPSLADVKARMLQSSADGSLQAAVRTVVAGNKARSLRSA